MLRCVFWGNSESHFSNRHFQALLESRCSVVAVVDVPPARRVSTNQGAARADSFVAIADRRGLPIHQPASPNTAEFVATMRALAPDLYIAVGYLSLLGPRLLALPRVAAANFHASLLPAYRGKHPVFWALRNGERWCGLTIHRMEAGLDAGDIMFQVRVPTRRDDSVERLYDRIMRRSRRLVSRLVAAADRGRIPARKQDESGASCFSSVTEEDFRLRWSMDAEVLRRWIAASPGTCYCDIPGVRVRFADATTVRRRTASIAGTVLALRRGAFEIATGGGVLRIGRAQGAEGGWMPAAALLAQRGLQAGDTLP